MQSEESAEDHLLSQPLTNDGAITKNVRVDRRHTFNTIGIVQPLISALPYGR